MHRVHPHVGLANSRLEEEMVELKPSANRKEEPLVHVSCRRAGETDFMTQQCNNLEDQHCLITGIGCIIVTEHLHDLRSYENR